MRLAPRSLALVLLVAAATPAWAMPPATAAHVDPKAPCYRWPAVDMDGDGVFDRVDHCPDTPLGCTVDQWGCSSDADGDGVCDGVDKCPNTPQGMKVDAHGCHEGAGAMQQTQSAPEPPKEIPHEAPKPTPAPKPVSESERQLIESGRIRLENLYFETNSARLLPESETALNEAGAALEKFPDLKIEVEGHTDTRGTNAHNMRLSDDRAGTVRGYLLDHFHLSPDSFVAKGYGETQPETKERNDEELLRNRRVVLRVLNPEALPRGVKLEQKH